MNRRQFLSMIGLATIAPALPIPCETFTMAFSGTDTNASCSTTIYGYNGAGTLMYFAAWGRELSKDEIKQFGSNPWQLYNPLDIPA